MWNLCLIGDPIHSLTEECSASVQQPTKKRRTFGQGEQQLGAEDQGAISGRVDPKTMKGFRCDPTAAPDLSHPFKLEVDASHTGAGAVLLQEDAGRLDHPVCCYSRKFNQAQRNYSTIEKETMSLIWALQHFHVYLGNSSFTTLVFTEHNPLVFLHCMFNHNQRLMRWAQEFNFQIRHKKGADNIIADALSRTFENEAPL